MLSDNAARASGEGIDGFSGSHSEVGIGRMEFAALMRKLDRIDPSYRD